MSGFLFQAFIYLTAAIIAVPIAKRLGLGSVLGYLIAGILIGPVIGLVGSETEDLQHFAEFGVVMMLFIVGLELDPRTLWQMRQRLLGLGGLQVALTVLAILGVGVAAGLDWRMAIACGLILSLSSTAIVLQTLNEKHLLKTDGGESAFSVLLFQDIAVIPMLTIIPLLAIPGLGGYLNAAQQSDGHVGGDHGAADHGLSLIAGLPGWAVALVTLAAIAAVILGGHYLSRPLLRFIAGSKLREMFTAAALLIVIGIAFLMTLVGVSPALGTFLGGVVLANSEYRHEMESDIEPFKGLLLGLFFITVGAGIDFEKLFGDFALILGATVGLILIKGAILFGLAWLFGLRKPENFLLAISLAQAGEFGFVLINFSSQNNVLTADLASMLSLIVALSMLITPLLFISYDRFLAGAGLVQIEEPEADQIDETGTAIIAGHGRFGQIINRMLMSNGVRTVVLDHRPDLIESLKKFDLKVFYGDATRADLLVAAGIETAKILVVAIDDQQQTTELVRRVKREYPGLHVIARANDRLHVYQLYKAGADDIVREVFDSSLRAGRYALEALGMHRFTAHKASKVFEAHDRETLAKLARAWREDLSVFENEEYISLARERNRMMTQAMEGVNSEFHDRTHRAWSPPPRRPDDSAEDSD